MLLNCPVRKCTTAYVVHFMDPDTALLDMMGHFLDHHAGLCPLALLDQIDYRDEIPELVRG